MKMLFRYPVAVVDHKLSVNLTPVLTASRPFFRDVLHSKIKHLEKTVICRKYGLRLGYFPKLTVESYYGIGRIDQLAKLLRELEICAEICPIIVPGL